MSAEASLIFLHEGIACSTQSGASRCLLLLVSSATSLHGQSASPGKDQIIHKVETCLPPVVVVKGEPPACTPLLTRMQQLHIQGVSIAVVHRGVIEWARGYGIATPDNRPVTPWTWEGYTREQVLNNPEHQTQTHH